jgi:hypothetical protein
LHFNKQHYKAGKAIHYMLLVIAIALASFSCKKDTLLTNSSAKLSFSQTQVLFDTVFTTIGSAFQYFTIHNNHNQPIKISSINLVGSYTSPFKINVDGIAGTSFSNITVPANDSIFVFVTVTINPNNVNNPVVIEDSLQFTTNGNQQYVDLIAWGQDAYFYRPNVFPKVGPAYSVIPCNNSIWTNDKPHVIFGYAVVDSGCTLTMEPGTKVYIHNNGVLWVYKDGSLQILGNNTNPVIVQGDRLEPAYSTQPGQWGEILLSAGSINNKISWAVIKNGTTGVEADTVGGTGTVPTLSIDHTIIKSMSQVGLLGQGSFIVGDDDVFADCQYYCVDLSIGGNYSFAQCTFANYWSYGQRQTPTLLINNWYQDINGVYHARPLTKAFFGNCIVYGSLTEELQLDSTHGQTQFSYYFEHCDLLTKLSSANMYHFSDSIINVTPPFYNIAADDYEIHTGSQLSGWGGDSVCHNPNYSLDLNATGRNCPSDLGAYQAK